MHDSLHNLLREWEVAPAPGPFFRAAVWRRIAAQKQRLSYRIWERTNERFSQPAWATALVATLLLVGSVSGVAWRDHQRERQRAAGLDAYILAVNPVARVAAAYR